jgi:hypothetical protein
MKFEFVGVVKFKGKYDYSVSSETIAKVNFIAAVKRGVGVLCLQLGCDRWWHTVTCCSDVYKPLHFNERTDSQEGAI